MMFRKTVAVVVFMLMVSLFFSCSKKNDEDMETPSSQKFTEKVADEALKTIQTPIEQAKKVEGVMAERKTAIEDQIEK